MGCKVCVVVAALVGACTPAVRYGYQYKLKQDFSARAEPEVPTVEARKLLASAKTVAFYPPDTCANIDPDVAQKRVQQLRASCGVLMSTLERAAERAGYEVYSWQNLRPRSGNPQRPIDFAREANVDVLFEINEFQLDVLDDSSVERSLTFFELDDSGAERPLAVSTQLAVKCRDHDGRYAQVQEVAATGAIDIKTVQVSDGRNYWHYRKTQAQSFGREYPRATFTGRNKRPKLARGLYAAGGILLAQGITLMVLDRYANEPDDPTTTYDEHIHISPWQYVLLGAGVATIGLGVVAEMKLAGKPTPDTVLCDETKRDAAAAVSVGAGSLQAQHTFTETKVGDPSTRHGEKLQAEMIADFIEVLSEVHGEQR